MQGGTPPSARRAGFTLAEMLVVLAIIVALVGVSWPALRSTLGRSELEQSAKQIRVELSRARLEAIESSTCRQFRFQPGAGQFETGPYPAAEEAVPGMGLEPPPSGPPVIAAALPDGLHFVDPRSLAPETALAPAAPGDWSPPVLFYPNGRSSNVRIRLADEQGRSVSVILRGMTGVAVVGPVEREEGPP